MPDEGNDVPEGFEARNGLTKAMIDARRRKFRKSRPIDPKLMKEVENAILQIAGVSYFYLNKSACAYHNKLRPLTGTIALKEISNPRTRASDQHGTGAPELLFLGSALYTSTLNSLCSRQLELLLSHNVHLNNIDVMLDMQAHKSFQAMP